MFCKNCGASLPEGGKFCPVCGQAAETTPASQPPAAPEAPVYANEAAPAPQPPVTPEAPVYVDETVPTYAPAPEAPKKKKGKRILISVIAALVAVCLIGGILAYALVFSKPEVKLAKAAEKTGEAFSRLYTCKRIKQAASNLAALQEQQQFGADASLEFQGVNLDYRFEADMRNKELSMGFTTPLSENPLLIYMNQDLLALTVENYMENSYSLPLKNLGDRLVELGLIDEASNSETVQVLNNLDPFATLDFDIYTFLQEHEEEVDAIKASVDVTKSDRVIFGAESATVYRVQADWIAAWDLLADYLEVVMASQQGNPAVNQFSSALNREDAADFFSTFQVYLGINEEGYLSAAELCNEDGGFGLLLNGASNPWETITFTDPDSVEGELVTTSTADGFRLNFREGTDADFLPFYIEYNDATGAVTVDYDGESMTMFLGCEDQGVQLSFDDPGSVSFTMTVRPMEQVKVPEDPVDFLSLSQEDMQMALIELSYGMGLYS